MDNLARNAMLAKQAGMSYGKWKAMQPPAETKKKEMPDGWLVCVQCGKPFKPKTKKRQRYCDITCQREAYKIRNREYMRKKRGMY